MERKCVKVTDCSSKLVFIRAIRTVTKKSLLESQNIADSMFTVWPTRESLGTLLLNESSISPDQWSEIVAQVKKAGETISWEYV